jgi:hypothetical protein
MDILDNVPNAIYAQAKVNELVDEDLEIPGIVLKRMLDSGSVVLEGVDSDTVKITRYRQYEDGTVNDKPFNIKVFGWSESFPMNLSEDLVRVFYPE